MPVSISVVIPARNEVAIVAMAIDSAASARTAEIIVSDGSSTDETLTRARARGAVVVESIACRGQQLNDGAAIATGEIIVFLHADTALPANFDTAVVDVMNDEQVVAGAFRLAIDEPGRAFRVLEKLVAWRSTHMQMPYGDQALFMRRTTFESIGGFQNAPAMEDYIAVRQLRRLGRVVVLPIAVRTSGRRWIRKGIIRTTLLNQCCIAAFRLGVSPDRIARWRNRLPRTARRASMPVDFVSK